MYDINLRTDLNYSLKFLQCFGCWCPEEKVTTWRTKLYKIYRLILCFIYFGYMYLEIMEIITSIEDLEKAMSGAMVFLGHLMDIIKLLFIVKNYDAIKEIIRIMDEDVFQPKNERHYKILMSNIKTSIRMYIGYLTGIGIVICGWSLPAMISKSKALPVDIWVPIDISTSPMYEIVFAFQTVFYCSTGSLYAASDFLIACILAHITTQLKILNEKANNLYNDALVETSNNRNVNIDMEILRQLNKFIFHHHAIIRLIQAFRDVFDETLLLLVVLSAFACCVITFLLSIYETVSTLFLTAFLYLFFIMASIYLFCWYGMEITYYSDLLSTSLYSSEWITCKIEYKKALQFTILNARPIKITPAGLITLSGDCILMIAKISYSFFAVLKQSHSQ